MSKRRSIDWRGLAQVSLCMALLLVSGSTAIGQVQESKQDINAVIKETQRIYQKADELTLVWWIPEEYWQVSFESNPKITKSQTEEFLKVLRPYIMVVVVDWKIGPFGGVTYKSEAEIRANIQVVDNKGIEYLPLSEDKIDADAKNFLSMMKPTLANMLGPMGKNMHFFVFAARNKKGQRIADAKKEGAFSIKVGEKKFRWRLPLGSVLPSKICTKCNEQCSGAWNYCPWCGTELPKLKQ